MSLPKISVIIPTYNRAAYLPQAMDSVLNQTYKDFEIIIVDDGSTDDTRFVIDKYMKRYTDKIRYIYQGNRGPSAARNNGIKHAKTKYIAFLDSDDIWLPTFLEKTVPLLQAYDWVVTSVRFRVWDKSGKITKEDVGQRAYLNQKTDLYKALLKENIIGGIVKIIFRKECFDMIGLFDERLKAQEDWDLCIRLAGSRLKMFALADPLYVYNVYEDIRDERRLTPESLLNSLRGVYRIINKYKNDAFNIDISFKKIYSEMLWNTARESLYGAKNIPLFFGCAMKSLFYDFNLSRINKSINTMAKHRIL